jgi:uncharacterized protein YqeY
MTLDEQFNTELKNAMRDKNQNLIDVVRQIKSRVKERIVAGTERIELNDAIYQDEIRSYIKQLKKGIEELKPGGERAEPIIAKYNFEIAYLSGYLPALMTESETMELVKNKIAEMGLVSVREMGKLMGAIMKEYRDRVDPVMTKNLAEKILS